MVPGLLTTLLLLAPSHQGDSVTFRDAATAELYARARVRHVRQDSLVRDYSALVETRLDLTSGRSRFSRQTTLFAHETVARVSWQAPNDLKVQVLGARSAAPALRMFARMAGASGDDVDELQDELRQEVLLDRPWFIPRSLGDSIMLMGVPDQAALHPLAFGAIDYYNYAITDSTKLRIPNGPEITAVKMHVMPKELTASLVAGDMWIDLATGDVVRLMVVFVGQYLWSQPDGRTAEDSADARNDNKWATRFLSAEADVEYALIENRYWLPYRQLLSLTFEIPWFVNLTMPVRALSPFSEYEVNTTPAIAFAVPDEDLPERRGSSDPLADRDRRTRVRVRGDTNRVRNRNDRDRSERGYARAGTWGEGRWEVEIPPADELMLYAWEEEFKVSIDSDEEERLRESVATLAKLSEDLPADWVGRLRYGVAWEEFSDIFRFNRVQGASVGMGYQLRPGPDFTQVLFTARIGLADLRPTGSAVWRRDGPGGRFDVKAYRTVREVEQWTNGLGIGNSLNGIFAGNDDADYHLALGSSLSYQWNAGLLRDFMFEAFFERQTNMNNEAGSPFGGSFQLNPRITEGNFVGARVSRPYHIGLTELNPGADVLADEDLLAGRIYGSAAVPLRAFGRTGTLTLRAGAMRGDDLPQLAFRLGGPQTVRGFTYGARRGREFWSTQLDFALSRSPFWAPVLFVDVGDTFSSDPMVGAGIGVSLLNGLIRFDLSKGINPWNEVRFDLAFRAPR